MSQSKDLWSELKATGIVDSERPKDVETPPWFILLMQGFAGWLAALFLLGFFEFLFSRLFFNGHLGRLLFLGFGCCAVAYALLNKFASQFFVQLSLAIHLCGQTLIALGLFELFESGFDSTPFFVLGIIQLALGFIMNDFVHRFMSYLFGLISFLLGLGFWGAYGAGVVICATVFVGLWMQEFEWADLRQRLLPLAMSSGVVLIIGTGFFLSNSRWLGFGFKNQTSGWLGSYTASITSFCLALLFLYLLFKIIKDYEQKLNSKTLSLIGFIALISVLLSFYIMGLSAGLLLLIVGFYKQRTSLMVLGLLATVLFFAWYYYNLNVSLLNKSLILFGCGVLCLLGRKLFLEEDKKTTAKTSWSLFPLQLAQWIPLAMVIASLLLINWQIHKKETLLDSGRSLVLQLAPVDPRSIMQGDYMRLRFAVQNQIRNHFEQQQQGLSYQQIKESSFNGFAILKLGENNVATFGRVAGSDLDSYLDLNPQNTNQEQVKIPFRKRGFQILLSTDAYYFQEGKAEHFQQAKYGEFKLSDDGEMILSHLLDESFNRL